MEHARNRSQSALWCTSQDISVFDVFVAMVSLHCLEQVQIVMKVAVKYSVLHGEDNRLKDLGKSFLTTSPCRSSRALVPQKSSTIWCLGHSHKRHADFKNITFLMPTGSQVLRFFRFSSQSFFQFFMQVICRILSLT